MGVKILIHREIEDNDREHDANNILSSTENSTGFNPVIKLLFEVFIQAPS